MADEAPKIVKATATNVTAGPKVFNSVASLILQPGQSTDGDVDISEVELASMKRTGYFDFGPGKKDDAPDYERDGLKDVDIHKASTSKDVLLVIAAYEGAEVPEGDDATKAQIIKAIEAKRKG